MLGDQFYQQLAEDQLRFQLRRHKLDVGFQAGLKAINQFSQLEPVCFARCQAERVGVDPAILAAREMFDRAFGQFGKNRIKLKRRLRRFDPVPDQKILRNKQVSHCRDDRRI